jgi:hypothetical protein
VKGMAPLTTRQQALVDLLVLKGPRTTRECVKANALEHPGYEDVPPALIDSLPRSAGTARDVLEALARKGEVVRNGSLPARYAIAPDDEEL